MWLFFNTRKWFLWSWFGAIGIIAAMWYQVQIDVQINEWFGSFYNLIQKALAEPNVVSLEEYFGQLWMFGELAAVYIAVYIAVVFFTSHWLFRWRTAMAEWYHSVYDKAGKIEGASQRVQEDTIKFTRIMEDLGTALVESILVLIAFIPVLYGLSSGLMLMWIGDHQYGLFVTAIIWAAGITVVLLVVGWVLRLVGVEYDIQVKEAAYRKMLVIAEDDNNWRPKNLDDLFADVRKIHYKNYFRYLWFNIARISCLQANVLVAYIILAPSIVGGLITLGVMQQIIRAFNKVAESMTYIFRSWPAVIELISVYKRLREFEKAINDNS